MLGTAAVFAFCLGLTEIVALKRCPSLSAPLRGTVTCLRDNSTISCARAPVVGSLAEFTCREFYKLSAEDRKIIRCLPSGSWDPSPPKCIPAAAVSTSVCADCGRRSSSVSLILNGAVATRGSFPWHVALYQLVDGLYEYSCGGSLVSEMAVITAGHCVWEIPPERLMLAFGKFHREYGFVERNVQKIRAKRVETLESYQDVGGNYNGDIAVVVLERAVRIGHYAAPVCLDWKQDLMDEEVAEGVTGVVVGWGLTEKEILSDYLRVVRLSVVSDTKCVTEQEREFKKFVTYTSFCAGLKNGSGVCNGDSGGGMAFFDEKSGRWYLQGVVSVSPRKRGTPYCNPRFYTVFTKVSMFSKWLSRLTEVKGQLSAKESSPAGEGKSRVQQIVFPHSEKMLRLAGLPEQSPSVTTKTSVFDANHLSNR